MVYAIEVFCELVPLFFLHYFKRTVYISFPNLGFHIWGRELYLWPFSRGPPCRGSRQPLTLGCPSVHLGSVCISGHHTWNMWSTIWNPITPTCHLEPSWSICTVLSSFNLLSTIFSTSLIGKLVNIMGDAIHWSSWYHPPLLWSIMIALMYLVKLTLFLTK